MYVLKGFITNTTFANNTPGVVAELGELSQNSLTFSREKGYYSNQSMAKNLILTTFISKEDTTNVPVPSGISDQVLQVANMVYNKTLAGQVNVDAAQILEDLLVAFPGRASQFMCGEMINDGTHVLPEWVSWKSSADTNNPDNFIKVWFVDASFQAQYDGYEIYVVPPFDTLDNFFLSGAAVENAVYAFNSEEKTARLQAAKSGYPETVIRTNLFLYIDPVNKNHQVPTDWGVLIYGPAGDNVDSIKDALMSYILSHSARTRSEWTNILPDIFKRTEFIILPLWDKLAIPNRVLETGIYSPQFKLATVVAKMKQVATQYPAAHIDSHVSAMGHPYRSIVLASIGSPDNRNSQYAIADVYPDLIGVTSTSVDFNRMSAATQEFASIIATMLVEAEKAGEFTTVPAGMTKVVRDGTLYLTKSFKNINYLMATKSNFTDDGA